MTILEWYQRIYDSLIEKRRQNPLTKDKTDPNYIYCETHHILPKSLGGLDTEENLINLTAREHFIAHKLLLKIYEKKLDYNIVYKMTCALSMMICGKNKNIALKEIFNYNSRKYETERLKISKILSEYTKKRPGPSTGKHYIRNIDTNEVKLVDDISNLPEKWILGGFIGKSNHTIWITDGKENKKIKDTEEIPDSWHKGRTLCKKFRSISESSTKGSLNKMWIYNTQTNEKRYINKNDAHLYIYEGSIWSKGLNPDHKEKTLKALRNKNYNKIKSINYLKQKYGNNFDISIIDFDYYLSLSKKDRKLYREKYIEHKK